MKVKGMEQNLDIMSPGIAEKKGGYNEHNPEAQTDVTKNRNKSHHATDTECVLTQQRCIKNVNGECYAIAYI